MGAGTSSNEKEKNMVQSEIVQVDVAFLTYNPKICIDSPSVKQDSAVIIGMYELHKHRDSKRAKKEDMGPEAYHHYKWYNSMLLHELKAISEAKNPKLRLIHWHIESGNKEAFKMNGVLYRAVSIVIGNDMEHWYCANTGENGSHSYGSRYRNDKNKMNSRSKTIDKIACFTIDDDEATLIAKPTSDNINKCTLEICANNCIECKKFKSPFTRTNKNSTCACFPSKDEFQKINDSDCEDVDSENEDQDIAYANHSNLFKSKGKFNTNFKLNAIKEE